MEKKSGKSCSFGSLDGLCINTIRFLAVDAVEKAASGHPGMPMGDAPMAHVLWKCFLKHNPSNPMWPNRDRFVLSAGHGSMLLYSLLHLTGYGLTLDEIKNFRQWSSRTPGHPEYHPEIGIETTTGPLGQGFATGVGMAMAQKYLASRYNRPGYDLFDYRVYAITSDGDMMEGVSNEAASIAGHLGLGNIVYLYSDNKITIEGPTDLSFSEDVGERFKALGWHVQHVDGNDLMALSKALKKAKDETSKPSLVISRTNIGFGSPGKQDTAEAHGAPLGADEVNLAKEKLGWPLEPKFHIPQEVIEFYSKAISKGQALEGEWRYMLEGYRKDHPELAKELESMMNGDLPAQWIDDVPVFTPKDGSIATRVASGKTLNAIAEKAPFLIGGSADLAPSTNTLLKGQMNFLPGSVGRNLHFGVREHAMGAILNGMALSRMIVPYGATFLVFSDYMRPSIRLAALMKAHVIYIFTHDSIGLGEDGPTHQPIEHLSSLRAIPGLTVLRPCDANETAQAIKVALRHRGGPVALALTRQGVPVLDRTAYAPAQMLERGAYILAGQGEQDPDIILIATGSEVHLALGVYDELRKRDFKARVVSMPSCELFEAQDEDYKKEVLPPHITVRMSIEAASPFGWHRYVGPDGDVAGIDRFGASAPYKTIYEKLGLTVQDISTRAINLINKKKGLFLDRP